MFTLEVYVRIGAKGPSVEASALPGSAGRESSTGWDHGPKHLGVVFDSLVSEPASNSFPLEDIGVPTLIVHAPDDPLANYEHAIKAAARIRGAQLVTIGGGGHLFLGHEADGAQSNVVVRPTGRHRPNPRVPVPRRALYPGGGVGVRLGGVVQEWRVRK
jgi:pimeloyl-ACP methyl ester carboxylesterase